MKRFTAILAFLMALSGRSTTFLPSVFSDHMVLQRDDQVLFWGWDGPNQEIRITTGWDAVTFTTKTNPDGTWNLLLRTPKTGAAGTIEIKGSSTVLLRDVLLGEVWLCSGQSNMEMSASWGIEDTEAEVARALDDGIRFFRIEKVSASTPQNNVPGKWEICSPESMRQFSAVGYYFAQKLRQQIPQIPIGLIQVAWGGTPAEIWMPENAVFEDPDVAAEFAKIKPNEWGPVKPGSTWNAMVHPLVGFGIRGVIWYQGESNVGSSHYDKTLETLITSWRTAWQRKLPFYVVQIAPFGKEPEPYWSAMIRDAQRKLTQRLANTGLVVTSDISTIDDIHPKNKKTVGRRLAGLALLNQYGIRTGTEVESPMPLSAKRSGAEVVLELRNASGLSFVPKDRKLFELAGPDGVFVEATSHLRNGRLVLSAKKVTDPQRLRYAFHDIDQADLFNASGLPLTTFEIPITE